MKKKLLTLSMCLASLGGLYAQKTVYYNEGIVTDLGQLKTGDKIVFQNKTNDRPGFIDLSNENSNLIFAKTGLFNKEMFDFIKTTTKTFDSGKVFEVEVNSENNTYKFKNVENQQYIKNNTESSTQMSTISEDVDNTFIIQASGTEQWRIASSSNHNLAFDAESSHPVLYSGAGSSSGRAQTIYRVTETKPETPWHYMAAYLITGDSQRQGNCMENNTATYNQGIYCGNKVQNNNESQLWRLEENPDEAGVFAIVSKVNGGVGSIGNVISPDGGGARYPFSSDNKIYQFKLTKTDNALGTPTLRITRKEVNTGTNGLSGFAINVAGSGQGFYLNEWNTQDNGFKANMWTMVMTADLKDAGEYALGTFSAPYMVTIPEGVTAYVATETNQSTLILEELTLTNNILPANTPVVLKSDEAGVYPMLQTTGTADEITLPNLLAGTASDRKLTPSTGAFVLSQANGETGFYSYTGSAIGAFKAYLPKTTADGEQIRVKSIQFPSEGTTGVENIKNNVETKNAPIYNLNGQRVINPTKGIYIKNGKKFIVK